MDRAAWWATVHGVARVRHTEQLFSYFFDPLFKRKKIKHKNRRIKIYILITNTRNLADRGI